MPNSECPTSSEEAIAAIESAEAHAHGFEPVDALARRHGMSTAGLLNLFEGRVLFVKWVCGHPRLRTVDVERLFEA